MYDKKKDKKPVETVKKIKKIVKNLGFEIIEDPLIREKTTKNTPYSVRINHSGYKGIGTNGKGTTYEYSLASAYAEFLERLQNAAIFPYANEEYTAAPDEKKINYSDILNDKNGFWDEFLINFESNDDSMPKIIKDLYYLSHLRFKNLYKGIEDRENIATVPYYSINEDKVVYIPPSILMLAQTSNGMCAGNTPYEAMVQGFAEVMERYSLYEMIYNNAVFPAISKEIYNEYDELVKIIEYIESFGYTVTVKDASLGKNLPVICTSFEHKEKGVYLISIGSHPIFPVAIERTLTEFLQGFDVSKPDSVEEFKPYNTYESKVGEEFFRVRDASVAYRMATVHKNFFEGIPSYKYDKKTWEGNEKLTNKALLEKLINICLKIDENIYIRDVSFLGFPSYQIVIPKMSIMARFDESKLYDAISFFEWAQVLRGNKNYSVDKERLIPALEYNMKYLSTMPVIPIFDDEYVAIVAAIDLRKYDIASDYIQKLFDKNKLSEQDKSILLCLKHYLSLKLDNMEDATIKDELEKYEKNEIVELMFDMFVNDDLLVSVSKLVNYFKKKIEVSSNLIKPDIEKIGLIKEKIKKSHKKNIINQSEMGNIFKTLKIECPIKTTFY